MTDQELRDLVASTTLNISKFEVNFAKFQEENRVGFAEIREMQRKTAEGLEKLERSQEKTDEQLKKTDEGLEKLKRSQEKTDEQLKKTDEGLEKLKRSQEKTDEQLKKTDEGLEKLKKSQEKTDEQLRKTIAKLDGMGVTQGEISEDMFGDNLEDLFEKEGKHIYKVEKNLIIKGKCEYDLIGVNGSEVFVGEVKTRLTNKHIDEFIAKRLKPFKKYVPRYGNYKLYGFVAGRTLAKGALEYATKNGLYVLKQDSKGMAKFINNIPLEII